MNPRAALAWSFAERYASFAIGLVGTMLLARLLTPAQVGVFSMCAAITAMLGIVRDFGTSEYLIQARELDRARYRAAVGVVFASAWALALALWAGAPALARAFDEPSVATVMRVLALQFALFPLTAPLFALLNREMAFRRIFVLQLSCNAVQTATSLALAWAGWGSLALAWGVVANIGTQTVWMLAWRMRGPPSEAGPLSGVATSAGSHLGEVLAFGRRYMAARGLETLARHIHEPLIAHRFDFAAVGLYSRAHGMVEMFHSNVADAVVRVTTPAFAAAQREGRGDAALGEALARATALYVAVSWPFFGFVALTSEEIIRVLFGPQWVAAAPIASVLALAALPAGLYELVPQMLSATGHVRRRLRIGLLVAPVHILGVWMASRHSLLAVAAVSCLSSLWMLGLCTREVRAAFGLSPPDAVASAAALRPAGRVRRGWRVAGGDGAAKAGRAGLAVAGGLGRRTGERVVVDRPCDPAPGTARSEPPDGGLARGKRIEAMKSSLWRWVIGVSSAAMLLGSPLAQAQNTIREEIRNRSGYTPGQQALLPDWCRDSQDGPYGSPEGGSGLNRSPRAAYWVSLMGTDFWHMHHYCRALRYELMLGLPDLNPRERTALIDAVIDELRYIIRHCKQTMPLMPEVYLKLGQMHLRRNSLGEASDAFLTSRRLKPDYWPAYTRWAEVLIGLRQVEAARSLLEEGLVHAPNQPELVQMLRRAGGQARSVEPAAVEGKSKSAAVSPAQGSAPSAR